MSVAFVLFGRGSPTLSNYVQRSLSQIMGSGLLFGEGVVERGVRDEWEDWARYTFTKAQLWHVIRTPEFVKSRWGYSSIFVVGKVLRMEEKR